MKKSEYRIQGEAVNTYSVRAGLQAYERRGRLFFVHRHSTGAGRWRVVDGGESHLGCETLGQGRLIERAGGRGLTKATAANFNHDDVVSYGGTVGRALWNAVTSPLKAELSERTPQAEEPGPMEIEPTTSCCDAAVIEDGTGDPDNAPYFCDDCGEPCCFDGSPLVDDDEAGAVQEHAAEARLRAYREARLADDQRRLAQDQKRELEWARRVTRLTAERDDLRRVDDNLRDHVAKLETKIRELKAELATAYDAQVGLAAPPANETPRTWETHEVDLVSDGDVIRFKGETTDYKVVRTRYEGQYGIYTLVRCDGTPGLRRERLHNRKHVLVADC